MIPNVFVSSTILDLHHLRDSIRDALLDMGYNPILSEYGDVGYIPTANTEESCYVSVNDCQLAVLIIGKRYGSITTNGKSVTHNEFDAAINAKIPVFSLVDKEVMSFKLVYDANATNIKKPVFPGMDNPEQTFALIQRIHESKFNNGILAFASTAEARELLKKQIAHFFNSLLRDRFDPIKYEIKDILSEIKTLKHELVTKKKPRSNKINEPWLFLKAIRYLLDDSNKVFSSLIQILSGTIDDAVPNIIRASSFDEYLKLENIKITINETRIKMGDLTSAQDRLAAASFITDVTKQPSTGYDIGEYILTKDRTIAMNKAAKEYMDASYLKLKKLLIS